MKSYLSLSSIAVACAISLVAVGAQAAFISKSSGATTPTPSDFSAPFAGHPNKVGYNHPNANGMFLETFQAKCPTGQKVGSALFKIKVKKLGAGTSSSDNDALAFWDGGAVAFNTYLWSASDAVGAVKTLNFNMAALPPVGAGVINSPNSGAGGSGMALFNDADFSFSVQDDTSVLEASLEYSCSPDEPARKGLTWGTYPADPVTGSITVSCQGQSASPKPGGACDPYNGDTPGTTVLPVLCFRKLGLPNPVPNAAPTSDPAYWSGVWWPPRQPSAQLPRAGPRAAKSMATALRSSGRVGWWLSTTWARAWAGSSAPSATLATRVRSASGST